MENSGEPFDVFLWANEIDEVKNNVSAELFLFNKNYTPYKIKYSDKLTGAVKSMFMQEAVHYIIEEADKGLECREYERADGEEKVIYRTSLSKVGRAETLIHLIENEYKDIDYFSENEYDFKKVKGIIAKFTYPGEDGMKTFYVAKILPASAALKGATSWEINGESFEPFSAEIALKMPEDNQVAIVDGTIIVFNQAKFENLFQYDYKSQVIAEAKARELTEKDKLSFAEGLTLDSLLADKKPGVLCHSAGVWDYNTLIANIQAYLAQKVEWHPREENSFAPALCNRIDRNTSGIVIAAKNAETLRIINEKIKTVGEAISYIEENAKK